MRAGICQLTHPSNRLPPPWEELYCCSLSHLYCHWAPTWTQPPSAWDSCSWYLGKSCVDFSMGKLAEGRIPFPSSKWQRWEVHKGNMPTVPTLPLSWVNIMSTTTRWDGKNNHSIKHCFDYIMSDTWYTKVVATLNCQMDWINQYVCHYIDGF